ncbi:MAG: hypothetical protein RLZZ15_3324 [Verrucomicrobiota bacterium]|jgi:hypothetical protein
MLRRRLPPRLVRSWFVGVGLVVASFLAGCATVKSTRKVVDLAPFKHIFVVHRLVDDHHVDQLIVAELKRLGHDASAGPLTMMPDKADAVLTYEDRWEWDFKTYLIEFNFEIFTARTKKKLADGRYYAPSPKSRPPAAIIHDALAPLYATK